MLWHQSKKDALKKGKELLKRMKGKGWYLYVHYNDGWHYKVINDTLQVLPYEDGKMFYALFSNDGCGGDPAFTKCCRRSDPNKVAETTMKAASKYLNMYIRKVHQICWNLICKKAAKKLDVRVHDRRKQ